MQVKEFTLLSLAQLFRWDLKANGVKSHLGSDGKTYTVSWRAQ